MLCQILLPSASNINEDQEMNTTVLNKRVTLFPQETATVQRFCSNSLGELVKVHCLLH